MRRLPLALMVIFLAPTAVMAMAGRESIGDSVLEAPGAAVQQGQPAPGGLAGSRHRGPGENVILAKGDKTGTGPGHGGHKGQHKGEKKGGQKHDK